MKNIIFVNDAFFGGGAEKSMRILLDKLPKKKEVNYFLITLESVDKNKIKNWCEKRNIKVLLLTNTKNIFIFKILQFFLIPMVISWKLRNRNNISILSFQNRSNYISVICRSIMSIQNLIISERNYSSKFFEKGIKGFFNRKLISFLYPFADKIITNSKESKIDLIDNFQIDQKKLLVINNGYDFDSLRLEANKEIVQIQELLNDNLKKDIFVTVARLEKQKGFFRLFDAIAYYKNIANNDFIWVIIGKGSLKRKLFKYAQDKLLNDQVIFFGQHDNPLPLIKSANLFLFGSYFEGFPNALAEAVILNTPIISFDFKSGLNEVIEGYPNATVISSNSSNDFANQIKKSLNKKRMYFVPSYNLTNLIEKYSNLLFDE